MATNYIQGGSTIEFTADGAVSSGDIVVIGGLVAISLDDVADTEVGVAKLDGVFEVPKTTGAALTQGAVVDYDVSAKEFAEIGTPATGDLIGAGVVWENAASDATTVLVKINASGAAVTA